MGKACAISIHALREEGDVFTIPNVHGDELFLSTPSARRATTASLVWGMPIEISIHALGVVGALYGFVLVSHAMGISIHALRVVGDTSEPTANPDHGNFYPRPPRGGRPECIAG